jgi:hypothetical protein
MWRVLDYNRGTNLARALGHGGLKCAAAAALLALLYVLSSAPVALLAKNHPASLVAVARFYYPITWLHNHTPLRKPLEAYGKIWGFN